MTTMKQYTPFRFRGKNTYKPRPSDSETPCGKSETVQNKSYTVSELIQRYQMGLPVMKKEGFFSEGETDFDDLDHEDFGRMDFNDKFNIHHEQHQKVQDAKTLLRKRKETQAPPQ